MISAWVIGTEVVAAKLDMTEPRVRGRLRKVVNSLALRLMTLVKASKLSGGVLNVRTGRLRRSVNRRVDETATGISASVGTNVEYAAPHEFGFTGTVTVKAHMRQIAQRSKQKTKGAGSGGIAYVKEHTRQVSLPMRSFLRSSLREMAPAIHSEMAEAARDEAQQVMK